MPTLRRPTALTVALAGHLALALAMLVATQVSPWHPTVTSAAAVEPIFAVALPVSAAVAAWTRRWILAAAFVALSITAAIGHLPQLLHSRAWLEPTPTSVEIVTSNVEAGNERLDEIVTGAEARGADIVVLQEVTPEHAQRLAEIDALDAFTHSVIDDREGFYGGAIFSRLPLGDSRVTEIGGWPIIIATVHGPAGPFVLANVHLAAPLDREHHRIWSRQLDGLGDLVDGASLPVVLAGDFNATAQNRPFRELLDRGLTDAHDARGSGWGGTWPADRPGPPLLRLDHVLVTDEVEVLRTERLANPGSDHMALAAVFDLAPPEGAATAMPDVDASG